MYVKMDPGGRNKGLAPKSWLPIQPAEEIPRQITIQMERGIYDLCNVIIIINFFILVGQSGECNTMSSINIILYTVHITLKQKVCMCNI